MLEFVESLTVGAQTLQGAEPFNYTYIHINNNVKVINIRWISLEYKIQLVVSASTASYKFIFESKFLNKYL